ncbi:hypothetical protein [Lignipirellula cremea]|uniref:hypothetical protein n=1 Tax=Lignipirellula cremea TaxID=2528010 RepID=UPI0011A61774|nr:hypothetical protein [Lignipirellula cremea]
MISLAILLAGAGAVKEESKPTAKVERAARHYRIELYNQYRFDRAEYDRHLEAVQDLLSAWKDGEHTDANADAAIAWLEGSHDAVLSGQNEMLALPTIPPAVKEQPAEEGFVASPAVDAVRNTAVSTGAPHGPLTSDSLSSDDPLTPQLSAPPMVAPHAPAPHASAPHASAPHMAAPQGQSGETESSSILGSITGALSHAVSDIMSPGADKPTEKPVSPSAEQPLAPSPDLPNPWLDAAASETP